MDTGVALILALLAAVIIYGLCRWGRITVLSSIVLALFFGSIILALLANPQNIGQFQSGLSVRDGSRGNCSHCLHPLQSFH